jgi:hypothetical protein
LHPPTRFLEPNKNKLKPQWRKALADRAIVVIVYDDGDDHCGLKRKRWNLMISMIGFGPK